MLVLLEKFKHGGHRTYQVAAAVVGAATVAGSAMSANASKKASNAQSAAADQANATQRYQFDETNRVNAPFRETGLAANNKLANLMGIGSASSSQGAQEIYSKLLADADNDHLAQYGIGMDASVNTKAVEAWKAQLLKQAQKQYLEQGGDDVTQDPSYGSLLRNFSQADLDADPIYQNTFKFALDEGGKGLNRIAAASGNFLSGAAAKALTRFGANTAATYGNDAFNRNNTEKVRTYNSLAGVSGAGQQATNQVAAAGQNMANNISANQIGAGNARGASAIAGANSFNNALSSGVNAYQQNQLMNSYVNNSAFDQSNGYNSEMARLNGSL